MDSMDLKPYLFIGMFIPIEDVMLYIILNISSISERSLRYKVRLKTYLPTITPYAQDATEQ